MVYSSSVTRTGFNILQVISSLATTEQQNIAWSLIKGYRL